MRTLEALAHEVLKQSESLRQLNSEKHLRDSVQNLAGDITELAAVLQPLVKFAEDAEKEGLVERRPTSQTAKKAQTTARTLATLSKTDPIAVLEHPDLAQLRIDAAAAARELRNEEIEAWRTYCAKHIPVPQRGLLELLEAREDGPTSETVHLARLDSLLQQMRVMDPTQSAGSAALLVSKIQERHELWASFDLDHVPASVRVFLDLCAESGAPLSALTEEVLAWLTEEGLQDRYVVVPGEDS